MIRVVGIFLFLFTSLPLFAWQQGGELVFTASEHLGRAEEHVATENYDSALYYCLQAFQTAPSFREVYITWHKVYEAMGAESSLKIKNIKAGQQVSQEDEELAYYLAQVYEKEARYEEAIAEYTQAIAYSQAHEGEVEFLYYYYTGRATSQLKSRHFEEAIADFTSALDLRPESTVALINRGYCFYNAKKKEEACADWRKAKDLGGKAASTYLEKYCFE